MIAMKQIQVSYLDIKDFSLFLHIFDYIWI